MTSFRHHRQHRLGKTLWAMHLMLLVILLQRELLLLLLLLRMFPSPPQPLPPSLRLPSRLPRQRTLALAIVACGSSSGSSRSNRFRDCRLTAGMATAAKSRTSPRAAAAAGAAGG